MSLLLTTPGGISVVVALLALRLPLLWMWRISVAFATSVTAAQHLHLLSDDFRSETLLIILACPFTSTQALA
ncbi:hypothetical protein [Alcaligenes ammonioxydans]|uniref:hypothetical protein n=1 Tax=Alcaligenes ammonioxydans TaxID=2582914 RepID=UPI003D1A5480